MQNLDPVTAEARAIAKEFGIASPATFVRTIETDMAYRALTERRCSDCQKNARHRHPWEENPDIYYGSVATTGLERRAYNEVAKTILFGRPGFLPNMREWRQRRHLPGAAR